MSAATKGEFYNYSDAIDEYVNAKNNFLTVMSPDIRQYEKNLVKSTFYEQAGKRNGEKQDAVTLCVLFFCAINQ